MSMTRVAPFVLASLLGCSTRGSDASSSDAVLASATPSGDVASQAVGALRRFGEVRRAWSPQARFADAVDGGAFEARSPRLLARAPRLADEPVRLTAGPVTLEISPEELGRSPGSVRDGVVVYPGAARSTDVALLAGGARVEEFRLLRDPNAPTSARWRLRPIAGVASIALRDGRVYVTDDAGVVRLSTDAMYVVDAEGTRRDVSVQLHGEVLAAQFDASGLRHPILLDPAWTTVASMSQARFAAMGALLPSGKVLVAGGTDGTAGLSTTEIYDPAANTWTAGPSMGVARGGQAIALPTGKILAVGGGTSELYDPATNAWSPTSPPGWPGANCDGAFVVHPNGRVYSTGGYPGTCVRVYDPATNAWSAFASTLFARRVPDLAVLPDGKLFVHGDTITPSAEVYDFATGAWARVKDAPAAHGSARLLMHAGKVHAFGGFGVYHVYDPTTDTWSAAKAKWHGNRENRFSIALLGDGDFLVFGGYFSVNVGPDRYDQATDTWTLASSPSTSFGESGHVMVQLPGERFLLAGGNPTPTAVVDIFELMPNGTACTNAADCKSAMCVDGACCNRACTGACEACNLTGSAGTCSNVASGPPVHGGSCAPYNLCVAGACATSCTTTSQCTSTSYCKSGSCVARSGNGVACTTADQCVSGNCVDGVCCSSACGGQCQACDVAGAVGSCTLVTSGAPHGSRPACTGTGVGTTCGVQCTGASATACAFPAKTAPCSANACASGIETHASFCDGAGKCNDVARSCGAFTCDPAGVACKSVCTGAGDCAPGFWCTVGVCVPVTGLGKECSSDTMCASGHCTDGVCCGVASCEAGSSCANPGKRGTCSKSLGATCAAGAECGSGFCVDGVCCSGACDGQCEACDVAGRIGTCWPVSGVPHGARDKCSDGGGDVCRALRCDGAVDSRKCSAYARGLETSCAPATCTGSTFAATSYCDGVGACRVAEPKSCAPFACDAAACRTTCDTDAHCSAGNVCKGAACVPNTARCSSDGLASIDEGTVKPCGNYRCNNGVCATNCAATTDCAPGAVCDSGTCVVPTNDGEDSGGCSAGRRASSGGGALAGLLLALGALRRRRG
ncbi:MAG: hypothetical protein HYV09_26195 [Deltaproteobacteria bacterium]|nr:hypothetical protein [Deltaproteobacteria bacterium]